MRGNGLSASSYVPVADLPAAAADTALDRLRVAGVAAWAGAAPSPGLERLYVDAAARDRVGAVLDGLLPVAPDEVRSGPSQAEVEALFAGIVAGFDAAPVDEVPRWPATEDLPEVDGRVVRAAGQPQPQPRSDGEGWPEEPPAAEPTAQSRDPEDRFVPPPPPPLPEGDVTTRLAWAGALGGPGVLLVSALLGWQLLDWQLLLATGAFLGGFAVLVTRLKDRDDDDPDDGAVV